MGSSGPLTALGARLRRLRERRGLTQLQLGQALGLAESTISLYESGKRGPDIDTMCAIAKFFDVSVGFLYGEQESLRDMVQIPIVGVVRAGPNGIAYEEHIGMEPIDKADVTTGDTYFWLRVKGDSMIGDAILPGDMVLVRLQHAVDDGDIAVVVVNGEEGTIKRVYRVDNGIMLQASNPAYPPRIFAGADAQDVHIVGRVMQIKRKV